MAQAVWGLDIGKYALKAARLERVKNAVKLTAIDYIEYPAEPDEEGDEERVRSALIEFAGKNKVRGERLIVALPGHVAFSRFVKIPHVEEKKLDEIVRYEAQQQIPFPIDDVVWDYQPLTHEDGEEMEVGIFAIKQELVAGFLADLRAARLQPDGLTIAPLALFNFVRFELGSKLESTVVVDIGADHTDLVIVDRDRFWIRNLPLAGNDLSKALMEKFGISFDKAEELKHAASRSKPHAQKVYGAIQPLLKDLVGEIHRSVGFYKSQQRESRIEDLLVVGNASHLMGMARFLGAELHYQVHRLQDLETLSPTYEVDKDLLSENLPGFPIALGLALQGVGEASVNINLLPQEIQKEKELKGKRPFFIGAAGAVLLGILFIWQVKQGIAADMAETIERAGAVGKYSKWKTDCKILEKDLEVPKAKAERLAAIGKGRTFPLEVLRAINFALPRNGADMIEDQGEKAKPFVFIPKLNELNEQKLWITGFESSREPIQDKKDRKAPPIGVLAKFRIEGMVRTRMTAGAENLRETVELIETKFKGPLEGELKRLGARNVKLDLPPSPQRFAVHPGARDPNERNELANPQDYTIWYVTFEIPEWEAKTEE